MTQEQYSRTFARTDSRALPSATARQTRSGRVLRYLFAGVSFALLLTCLESALWLLNPGHLFGVTSAHTLSTFFSLPVQAPLLLLVPLLEIASGFWLALLIARPLAVRAYLAALWPAQEEYRTRYTSLRDWFDPYEIPVLYSVDDPDPAQPRQTQTLPVLSLIETFMTDTSSHLILLGERGAGKTQFAHQYLAVAARRRRDGVFGRFRLPLFVPLKYYAPMMQALDIADPADFSLRAFLAACDLPGMDHIRPHLDMLFRQGRLLFLCDGLDEVPAAYRQALDQELIMLLRQNRNGLLLTCTEKVYEQSPDLIQAAGENLVPRAVFEPLDEAQMRSVVERFLTEADTRSHANLPTAGQIMNAIERTRLRFICPIPLYLFALLDLIDVLPITEISNLDTRGRLLHAFLFAYLESSARAGKATPEDLLSLRDLACLACWNGDCSMLPLPSEAFLALEAPAHDSATIQQALGDWAREQQVHFPFATQGVSELADTFPAEQVLSILQRAYRAALVDIDRQGMLSFRHPLLASTLVAEYLAGFLGIDALRIEEIDTFPDDIVPWSEPLTLWAGLLDSPLEASAMLATYAWQHAEQRISALLVSLICLGVAQIPSGIQGLPISAPPALEAAFGELLDNQPALAELARLFLSCAEQGSPELYQALFPLLMINGSEAFFALLDPERVSELLFQRLLEIINDAAQEALVKRLVRALSGWGAAVVPRASWLCSPASSSGNRLRTAAINLLGGTRERSAVEPLLVCLRDSDQFIARRAANALTRLGPELALPRLLQEIEVRVSPGTQDSLHSKLLPILEHFLNETSSERQLSLTQFERVIDALMTLLTTHPILADVEQAREILVAQGRMAGERDSGKMAIRKMLQKLASGDDAIVRDMTGTLKEVGAVATPDLLAQLEGQSSISERVRILEILSSVRDERALPALLRLLADSSVAVQQALARTLAAYSPSCIPGLIDTLLHHSDEMVAARAEQILGDLGPVVSEPVIQALTPPVAGRTPLLVHVLERVHDPRAVPALISLQRNAQSDVALALAIVQALGQFPDERVVPPLLDYLTSANPLLYEGAINSLSNLGELACAELLTRLDTPEKTPLVARVERVLLGMQPFPGETLLQAVSAGSEHQARYIEEVFLARGGDAAQVLALNLFHNRPRVRGWVRRALDHMDGHYAVPALLEVLNKPDPAWRELIAFYLLKHPQEAIPPLVGLLDDAERGEAAVSILLQAGRPVLPALIPALDSSHGVVQGRASSILVTIARQQTELLEDVVLLFGLGLPQRAREMLIRLLTEELAAVSLPPLLAGLEDAHLVPEVSATLLHLARRDPEQSAVVLDELLQALRVPARRYGASLTLIDMGALAVPGVGALITDADPQVARAARHILGEIGTPAFSFLWAAHSDAGHPDRREAAREVFRSMPTSAIKDELVLLLSSARQEDISMALSLLLERIHDEALQPGRTGEMLPALLEHVQSTGDEQASLRILALLILLGGPVVAQALLDALYANPQRHDRLTQAFLLLGQGVEAALQAVLNDSDAPALLQAEIAGILAMREPSQEIQERALRLSEHGLWAGRSAHHSTTVLQPLQLEISLRALGGLLVGGHWNTTELQDLRAASKEGSAEYEIYNMLLGWRYSPQVTRLEHELEFERQERKQEMLAHTRELLAMKTEMLDLQHDLDLLKEEHEEQRRDYLEKSKELEESIAQLTREKQALQATIRELTEENETLATSSQQAKQQSERLQADKVRWQTYSEKLEKELAALRRPGS